MGQKADAGTPVARQGQCDTEINGLHGDVTEDLQDA
jgi:hypothetical protein